MLAILKARPGEGEISRQERGIMRPAIASLLLLLACTSAVRAAVPPSEDDAKVRELPTPRPAGTGLLGFLRAALGSV